MGTPALSIIISSYNTHHFDWKWAITGSKIETNIRVSCCTSDLGSKNQILSSIDITLHLFWETTTLIAFAVRLNNSLCAFRNILISSCDWANNPRLWADSTSAPFGFLFFPTHTKVFHWELICENTSLIGCKRSATEWADEIWFKSLVAVDSRRAISASIAEMSQVHTISWRRLKVIKTAGGLFKKNGSSPSYVQTNSPVSPRFFFSNPSFAPIFQKIKK